jgi:hypothetical protein
VSAIAAMQISAAHARAAFLHQADSSLSFIHSSTAAAL